jgi:FAD dependent oxidoreductase
VKRRDFLTGVPTGYSLMFLAGAPASAADTPRPDFDRIAPPENVLHMAQQERHMGLVELETDVLVAGGGIAGVSAAVAAARNGARVVLINDRSRLGGNSSSEVKMHIVGASCHKGRPGWRESGLLEEFRLDDAANNPQRCWELWDLLLYDKVVSEPNITLLLESILYAAAVKDGRIDHALVRCDKSEHLYSIKAPIFIDATGDSRLALEAGAEMRWGRETRTEFNESLVPEKSDRETLGSSILFTSRLHHQPMPFTAPKWARKVDKEQLRHRKITSWEYGYWWVEWGGDRNIIRENEKIRFELLSIVMGIWDHIKNSGEFPGASNYAMDWVGMMPGKRGSRRVMGDHILTQQDLMSSEFEDAVAYGGWPMDDHPPGGFDRPDLPPNVSVKSPDVYNIPLRSIYSKNVSNLLLAGRNISASHVAFTSTRVMGTCASIGQAAGTAAALCKRHNLLPRQLYQQKPRLTELQQLLLRDDATIRSLRNQDPLDLARQARVTASTERDEAKAQFVIDGLTRDIPQKEGHHWAARMSPDGAWIELAWDRPRRIREIQITFDTGFQRELTLSSQDSVNAGVIRAPQPETVRDYTVSARKAGGEPVELVAVKGNHQRLRRHRVEPVEASAIRIHVKATNGDDFARIFEVRCYA